MVYNAMSIHTQAFSQMKIAFKDRNTAITNEGNNPKIDENIYKKPTNNPLYYNKNTHRESNKR